MEQSKRMAEALIEHCFESWASCTDNSVQYCCRYCSSGATHDPKDYEHDSECPVLVAQAVMAE
jgi:hypothetical protein